MLQCLTDICRLAGIVLGILVCIAIPCVILAASLVARFAFEHFHL